MIIEDHGIFSSVQGRNQENFSSLGNTPSEKDRFARYDKGITKWSDIHLGVLEVIPSLPAVPSFDWLIIFFTSFSLTGVEKKDALLEQGMKFW